MKKTDYKTPNIRVVTLKITRHVCQNSLAKIVLSEGSDLNAEYGWIEGYTNDL